MSEDEFIESSRTMNEYRCPHCKKILKRDSNKQWIKSWCVEKQKETRIQKLKKQGP